MSTPTLIIAAAGELRVAWAWLVDATTPGRAGRNQRQLSPAAIKARNERALAERADKRGLVNAGRIVGGGQAPVNLDAIETQGSIADTVEEIAGEITLRVATVRRIGLQWVRAYRPDTANTNSRFTGALDWISGNIGHVTDPPILDNALEQITDCTTQARRIVGDDTSHRPLAASCPACGRRSLAWHDTSANPDEHHVACRNPNCRCDGRDCNCRLPLRQHGTRHVWPAASWGHLAQQIGETA